MARNKYVADYRLIEEIDARGRIKTTYEYIGKPWYFKADDARILRAKKGFLLLCVLCWICYIAALIPVTTVMHVTYISLPFAFLALPIWLLTETALSLYRTKVPQAPMERRQAERFANRVPPVSLLTCFLALSAVIGTAMRLVRGLMGQGNVLNADYLFLFCACGILIAGGVWFQKRSFFETETREEKKEQQESEKQD